MSSLQRGVTALLVLACLSSVPDTASAQLSRGALSIYLSGTGGYSYVDVTTETGNSTTQNILYTLPSLGFGVMVAHRVEFRVALQGIFVRGDVGDNAQRTRGIGGTLQALYLAPLRRSLSFYIGIGAGAFYSARTVDVGRGLLVKLSGIGFLGQVPIGLHFQSSGAVFMRGGFRLDVSYVAESPSADVGVTGQDATNVFANAELSVGFRF